MDPVNNTIPSQSTVQPQSPVEVKTSSKGKYVIGATVLVLIVLIVIVLVSFYGNKISNLVQNNQNQTSNIPPVSEWLTYTASDNTYSFKYPPTWEPEGSLVEVLFFKKPAPKPDPNNEEKYSREFRQRRMFGFRQISETNQSSNLELEEYMKSGERYISSKEILLNDLPVIEMHYMSIPTTDDPEGSKLIVYAFIKDNSRFSFSVDPEFSDIETVKQVIGTFKTSSVGQAAFMSGCMTLSYPFGYRISSSSVDEDHLFSNDTKGKRSTLSLAKQSKTGEFIMFFSCDNSGGTEALSDPEVWGKTIWPRDPNNKIEPFQIAGLHGYKNVAYKADGYGNIEYVAIDRKFFLQMRLTWQKATQSASVNEVIKDFDTITSTLQIKDIYN